MIETLIKNKNSEYKIEVLVLLDENEEEKTSYIKTIAVSYTHLTLPTKA